MLPQKVYEVLRWVVATVMPALIVLLGTIGPTLGIENIDTINIVIGAVALFLGSIFGISKVVNDKV